MFSELLLVGFSLLSVALLADVSPRLVFEMPLLQDYEGEIEYSSVPNNYERTEMYRSLISYHSPQLVMSPDNNVLLLIFEKHYVSRYCFGALNSCFRNSGPKRIMYKYSEDEGHTWSKEEVLAKDENPTSTPDEFREKFIHLINLFVDRTANRLIVVYALGDDNNVDYYSRRPGNDVRVKVSTDNGKHWYNDTYSTASIRDVINMYPFMEPNVYPMGLQKQYRPHEGRLIGCSYNKIEKTVARGWNSYKEKDFATSKFFCYFSDDNGKSWKSGEPVFSFPYNQTKVSGDFVPTVPVLTELENGDVMVIAHNQFKFHGVSDNIVMISKDGGNSFPYDSILTKKSSYNISTWLKSELYDNSLFAMYEEKQNGDTNQVKLAWCEKCHEGWKGTYTVWSYGATSGRIAMALSNLSNCTPSVFVAYKAQSTSEKVAHGQINLFVVELDGFQ